MCGRHWIRVPAFVQRLVWKHYRAGQCGDKSPSFEWCVAADAAVAAVARAEGQPKPWGSMFTAAFHPRRTADEVLAAWDAMSGGRRVSA
jgi:hypothetical protein